MQANRDIVIRKYHGMKFEELLEDLNNEIELQNYRVTRIYNIDYIQERTNLLEGVHIGFKYYKIVEFCNLNSCAELISSHLEAGVFMPAKFIIYQPLTDPQIRIAFLKPSAFANLFANTTLTPLANQLEKDMFQILDEIDF